jgi:hypothetical protein
MKGEGRIDALKKPCRQSRCVESASSAVIDAISPHKEGCAGSYLFAEFVPWISQSVPVIPSHMTVLQILGSKSFLKTSLFYLILQLSLSYSSHTLSLQPSSLPR